MEEEEVEGAGSEVESLADFEEKVAGAEEEEPVGDCDGGGATEDEAASASDAEGKSEEVEGPVGGLDEVVVVVVWFWLLFRE